MKDSDMKTVVKDLEEYHIVRAACWFHARHKFVNAYISDPMPLELYSLATNGTQEL